MYISVCVGVGVYINMCVCVHTLCTLFIHRLMYDHLITFVAFNESFFFSPSFYLCYFYFLFLNFDIYKSVLCKT